MNRFVFLLVVSAVITLFMSPFPSFAGSWNGWIYQDPYPTSVNLFDVKFVTPMKGWITGKYGTIIYTEDGGETWEAQESGTEEDIMRIAFSNEKTGWAVGERGSIIHTEDGGKTWIKQYNIKAFPTKIFFLNEREGWVTGATPMGVVFRTMDSGRTWQKVDTGINRAISSIYFINSQTGWILAGEEVHRTTDGGRKWERSKLPVPEQALPKPLGGGPGAFVMPPQMQEGLGPTWTWGGIAFANAKQGWAAVSRWVFNTEDGGKTWTNQLDTGTMDHGLRHIAFRGAQNGCATGWSIYCTEDGGKTWQERLGLKSDEDEMLGGVSLTGQSAGWAVGNTGRIFKTGDGGRSWGKTSEGNKCGNQIIFTDKKMGWLWGPRLSKICKTDDGGQTWVKQEMETKIFDLYFIDDSVGWALGCQEEKDSNKPGRIYQILKRTVNGGKTWVTQFKELIEKNSCFVIDLSSFFFANSEVGWIVGKKGIILYTEDGGEQWKRQQSGTTLHLQRVYFGNEKKGAATGDRRVAIGENPEADKKAKGVIVYTEDGGKHWRVAWEKIPTLLTGLFFLDENNGWATAKTVPGNLLLYSANGGKTWTEKSLNIYGYFPYSPYFLDKNRGVLFLKDSSPTAFRDAMLLVTHNGGKAWIKKKLPLKKYPWHVAELFERR